MPIQGDLKSEKKPQPSKSLILLVDDDYRYLEVLKSVLEEAGYLVFTATDGKEAMDKYLDKLRQGEIDLIVTDNAMIPMNGLALSHKLRKEYNLSIPILLHSGDFGSEGDEENERDEYIQVYGVSEAMFKYSYRVYEIKDSVQRKAFLKMVSDLLINSLDCSPLQNSTILKIIPHQSENKPQPPLPMTKFPPKGDYFDSSRRHHLSWRATNMLAEVKKQNPVIVDDLGPGQVRFASGVGSNQDNPSSPVENTHFHLEGGMLNRQRKNRGIIISREKTDSLTMRNGRDLFFNPSFNEGMIRQVLFMGHLFDGVHIRLFKVNYYRFMPWFGKLDIGDFFHLIQELGAVVGIPEFCLFSFALKFRYLCHFLSPFSIVEPMLRLSHISGTNDTRYTLPFVNSYYEEISSVIAASVDGISIFSHFHYERFVEAGFFSFLWDDLVSCYVFDIRVIPLVFLEMHRTPIFSIMPFNQTLHNKNTTTFLPCQGLQDFSTNYRFHHRNPIHPMQEHNFIPNNDLSRHHIPGGMIKSNHERGGGSNNQNKRLEETLVKVKEMLPDKAEKPEKILLSK